MLIISSVLIILNIINIFMRKTIKMFGISMVIPLVFIISRVPFKMIPDNSLYALSYERHLDIFEYGYNWISDIFLSHGIVFGTFRFFFLVAGLTILIIAIIRFKSNISLVLLGYVLSIFFIDQVQIRNTVMFSFVLLGISYLQKNTKLNILLAICLILIGASIQNTGYIYLLIIPIFIFIEKKENINIRKNTPSYLNFLVLVSIIWGIGELIKPQLTLIISKFGSKSLVEGYIQSTTAKSSIQIYLLYVVFYVVYISLFWYLTSSYKNRQSEDVIDSNAFNSVLESVALFHVIVAIPLIIVNVNFNRLLRNDILFLLILYSAWTFNVNKNSNTKGTHFIYIGFLIIVSIFYVYSQIVGLVIVPTINNIFGM